MQIESIAECSPWSILQYFWPALSDNWNWKPIFGLFESDRFTQVLTVHNEWICADQDSYAVGEGVFFTFF